MGEFRKQGKLNFPLNDALLFLVERAGNPTERTLLVGCESEFLYIRIEENPRPLCDAVEVLI